MSRRRLLVVAIAAFAALVSAIAIYAYLEPANVFAFNDDVVSKTLENELGDEFGRAVCGLSENGGYLCYVETDPGSGFDAKYRLNFSSDECWDANAEPFGKSDYLATPRTVNGCVDFWEALAGL